jgi:glycine/D-amino acid oxidase-like deaminating enzyme
MGASYHPEGATARHDRVNWALAEGAMQRGVHVHQGTAVTNLITSGSRVIGVETTAGPMHANVVMSAVGGHVTTLAAMAGLRLPIRTHPLQAFVTNHYEQKLPPHRRLLQPAFLRLANGARGNAHRRGD